MDAVHLADDPFPTNVGEGEEVGEGKSPSHRRRRRYRPVSCLPPHLQSRFVPDTGEGSRVSPVPAGLRRSLRFPVLAVDAGTAEDCSRRGVLGEGGRAVPTPQDESVGCRALYQARFALVWCWMHLRRARCRLWGRQGLDLVRVPRWHGPEHRLHGAGRALDLARPQIRCWRQHGQDHRVLGGLVLLISNFDADYAGRAHVRVASRVGGGGRYFP